MSDMKRLIVLIIIAIVSFEIYSLFSTRLVVKNEEEIQPQNFVGSDTQALSAYQVKIGDDTIFVDIADNQEERIQGLSGRAALERDHGMLFLFEKADRYGFWMKGMLFPLDIVWIKGDTILGFAENLPPNSSQPPPLYYAPEAIEKVLEINAGEVKSRGFKVGDQVEILLR